jgi:hypothetical protein
MAIQPVNLLYLFALITLFLFMSSLRAPTGGCPYNRDYSVDNRGAIVVVVHGTHGGGAPTIAIRRNIHPLPIGPDYL